MVFRVDGEQFHDKEYGTEPKLGVAVMDIVVFWQSIVSCVGNDTCTYLGITTESL
jgi:hypothetical protein